jgi:uncharacterized protein YqhQ
VASRAVAAPPTPAQGPPTPAPGSAAPNHEGQLEAQRDAPLGGQAVLEGVMMRGVRNWSVAVRKPYVEPSASDAATAESAGNGDVVQWVGAAEVTANGAAAAEKHTGGVALAQDDEPLGEIEVSTFPLTSVLARHRALRLPIVRGVVALGESLAVGFKALGLSANAQMPIEEGKEGPQEISGGMWFGTILVALVFAIGLFFLVPVGLVSLIKDQLHSSVLFWVIEGIVRTAIFLGYMLLLSRLRDLRRVFEYHGAEHKTISCFEAGMELTPTNATRFSRLHPRCGTSFLLIVMIVAIFVFAPIGLPAWYWLVATRILGVPLIAGISFEIIKFAGRNRTRRWVRVLMWPGMQLQLLTTREPDSHQLAVAIAALEAVLALEKPGELTAKDLVGVEVVA